MASYPLPRRSFKDFTLADMIDFIHLQLDESNYLYWRSRMELALPRHDMLQYVDPMVPIPPTQTLDCITNKLIPNPKYEEWIKVDHYILTQFRRTITEPVILNQISGLKTSREIWVHLEKSFFDLQSPRVPQIRHQLLTLRKGNHHRDDYLRQIQKISNVLRFVGHSVDEDDLVRFALGRLGDEHDDFVQGILARPLLPALYELRELLIEEDII
ncbi:hypothetical protein MKX01_036751 [Papaver californicum]|nr:hypothetical protein MKX01_036751 [Papaver californicum]